MTASYIKQILSKKHSEDFFMCEVKTGSSWIHSIGIIDAWAMKKSWAKPCSIAYEIKVSRGDFLQDDKWMKYLPFCNQFYFICPKNIISKDEVPKNAGLIYVSDKGKLSTKKKAPYNSDEICPTIYKYILMSRLDNDRTPFYSNKSEYIKDYINNKKELKDISYQFNSKMVKKVRDTEQQIKKIKEDLKEYYKIKNLVESKGIHVWHLYNVIEEILQNTDDIGNKGELKKQINTIDNAISYLKELLDKKVDNE